MKKVALYIKRLATFWPWQALGMVILVASVSEAGLIGFLVFPIWQLAGLAVMHDADERRAAEARRLLKLLESAPAKEVTYREIRMLIFLLESHLQENEATDEANIRQVAEEGAKDILSRLEGQGIVRVQWQEPAGFEVRD